MDRTNDSYNLYFDGAITEEHETHLKEMLEKHNLDTELLGILSQHYNFVTTNSYPTHKTLLWLLWHALGSYAVTIFFSEDDHPSGCEYQAKVDFYVEEGGRFEYEVRNSIYIHEDEPPSNECKERLEKRLVGFDNDKKVAGNIGRINLESFVEAVADA